MFIITLIHVIFQIKIIIIKIIYNEFFMLILYIK
jgi:hypothetical protein